MSYLLIVAAQSVKLLVPICDVLESTGIRPDEKHSFMSPKLIIVMHLLADIEAVFLKHYLRKLDGDSGLVIEYYQVNYLLISNYHITIMINGNWYVKKLQLNIRNFRINE